MRTQLIPAMTIAAIAAIAAASCGPPQPKDPKFVTYESLQMGAINAGSQTAAGGFSDITNRLAAAQEAQLAGTDVQIGDTAVNTGAPASGVHVIVKGSGFDNGVFGAPTNGSVSTSNAKDEAGPGADLILNPDGAGGWMGDAHVKCEKRIIVGFVVPAKKAGTGDIQVFVKPLEKTGSSSAVWTHSYTVRSENDDSQNSSE